MQKQLNFKARETILKESILKKKFTYQVENHDYFSNTVLPEKNKQ